MTAKNRETEDTATEGALRIRVGEEARESLDRAAATMLALQQGKQPAPYFGLGFAEVGQLLSMFTPKRWELIAALRESGPMTTAELARRLGRDYKNVHADIAVLLEWMAVEKNVAGQVSVPWREIVIDVRLPEKIAA